MLVIMNETYTKLILTFSIPVVGVSPPSARDEQSSNLTAPPDTAEADEATESTHTSMKTSPGGIEEN